MSTCGAPARSSAPTTRMQRDRHRPGGEPSTCARWSGRTVCTFRIRSSARKVYLNDFAFSDTTRQSKPAAREEFIAGRSTAALVHRLRRPRLGARARGRAALPLDRRRRASPTSTRPPSSALHAARSGDSTSRAARGSGSSSSRSRAAAPPPRSRRAAWSSLEQRPLNERSWTSSSRSRPRVDTLRDGGARVCAREEQLEPDERYVRKYGFLGDPAIRSAASARARRLGEAAARFGPAGRCS